MDVDRRKHDRIFRKRQIKTIHKNGDQQAIQDSLFLIMLTNYCQHVYNKDQQKQHQNNISVDYHMENLQQSYCQINNRKKRNNIIQTQTTLFINFRQAFVSIKKNLITVLKELGIHLKLIRVMDDNEKNHIKY